MHPTVPKCIILLLFLSCWSVELKDRRYPHNSGQYGQSLHHFPISVRSPTSSSNVSNSWQAVSNTFKDLQYMPQYKTLISAAILHDSKSFLRITHLSLKQALAQSIHSPYKRQYTHKTSPSAARIRETYDSNMPIATKFTIDPASEITAEVGGEKNVQTLHKLSRDFRSDTMTVPTDAQLLAGLKASRHDDVYGEDETTSNLEKRIAKLAGKEAALFGMSGTMTNQLSIRSHMKQPPHSVITDHRAHVHKMEGESLIRYNHRL